MKKKEESVLRPLVEVFVEDLKGRYLQHCSEKLLVALLMRELSEPWGYDKLTSSKGHAVLHSDPDVDGVGAAESAGCQVFESLLENECGAGDGYRAARDFA